MSFISLTGLGSLGVEEISVVNVPLEVAELMWGMEGGVCALCPGAGDKTVIQT